LAYWPNKEKTHLSKRRNEVWLFIVSTLSGRLKTHAEPSNLENAWTGGNV
jgi:hypothetical protein